MVIRRIVQTSIVSYIINDLYRSVVKRLFDCLTAICGIFILLPLFALLVPVVSISNNGQVLFLQERTGLNGRSFRLIKLKTMNDRKDTFGKYLPDRIRLTPVGRFIRSLSLDELPQLINVILGDMSIVGPRPLLPEYLPYYNNRQARRHNVRPGITGWAQVNGRNNLDWEDRFEYDIWYVDNISFCLDIKIIIKTIYKVIKKEGINSLNAPTMKPFKGAINNDEKNE